MHSILNVIRYVCKDSLKLLLLILVILKVPYCNILLT